MFIDTNVLIYLYSTEQDKQQVVLSLLESDHTFYISTHVIMEFCNVLIKKLKYSRKEIEAALEDFKANFEIVEVDLPTIEKALHIQEQYRYAFFDSLVLATALLSHCTQVYSEDMQHDQLIENTLRIRNPFLKQQSAEFAIA
ncbi:MAG: PIN domain-containing protein [bacterium]|nr:PIN domain-containing protein [bacterium]